MRAKVILLLLWAATAHAADDDESGEAPNPQVADEELGARIGASLNLAGIGPGGFYITGNWLYRLTSGLWFDARAGFSIGNSDSNCTIGVGPASCNSAVTSGFGVDILGGVRWFAPASGKLVPWLGGGTGFLYANFSGDHLSGFGLPFWVAGGVRARVSDAIAIGGEALFVFGPVRYESPIFGKAFANLHIMFGVDFAM